MWRVCEKPFPMSQRSFSIACLPQGGLCCCYIYWVSIKCIWGENTCNYKLYVSCTILKTILSCSYRKRFVYILQMTLSFLNASFTFSGCLQIIEPNNCTPLLHCYYSNFNATMNTSDAAYYIPCLVARLGNNGNLIPSAECGSSELSGFLLQHNGALIRQLLTFRINACVMFLPPQCRRTCNQ